MRKPKGFPVLLTLLVFGGQASAMDYRDLLKKADQAVERDRVQGGATVETFSGGVTSALSAPTVRGLYGRFYQVGDTWEVAMIHLNPTTMRRVVDLHHPDSGHAEMGQVGVFKYRVIEVGTGSDPQVSVEITQLEAHGYAPIDKRIERVVLKMRGSFKQSRRELFFKGHRNPVRLAADTLRIGGSPLEFFPLDAPEVSLARGSTKKELPNLPKPLHEIVKKAERRPDLNKSYWFEQEDHFGRPLEVLWQEGEPWPSYIRTSQGIAVLLGVS